MTGAQSSDDGRYTLEEWQRYQRMQAIKADLDADIGKRDEETKRAIKEAVDEWLDEKFAQVGKWTVRGIIVTLFGAAVWFIVWSRGLRFP
ncbi:MAG TPA: hypothetical protein VGF89_00895 [Steroidobacteraceae bacterium]